MNPDKAALLEFMSRTNPEPIAVTTNPLALSLKMELVEIRTGPSLLPLLRLRFDPDPLFVQGAGVLQGGALSAMVDFAMGFVAMMLLPEGQVVATTTLDVAFLRAALPGQYEATAHVVRMSRAMAFTQASLVAAGGTHPVVTASSTLLVVPDRAS